MCVGRSSPTTSRPSLSVTVASDDVAVAEHDHLTTELSWEGESETGKTCILQ